MSFANIIEGPLVASHSVSTLVHAGQSFVELIMYLFCWDSIVLWDFFFFAPQVKIKRQFIVTHSQGMHSGGQEKSQ